jgi:formylglycine-generating enzyme required for sulfatase activity
LEYDGAHKPANHRDKCRDTKFCRGPEITLMLNNWIATFIAAFAIALGGVAVAAPESPAAQASETFRDCSDCPEMVAVPAGTFLMGSSAAETARDLDSTMPRDDIPIVRGYLAMEHPQHAVNIGRSVALGKYHVTREEFAAFVRDTGYSIRGGCTLFANHRYEQRADAGWQNPGFTQTDRDPVVCVSWQDAKAYVAWLNEKLRGQRPMRDDGPYRLPSEAEWEYAARAGTRTARWWGDAVGSGRANCDGCGSRWDKKQPAPVGSFEPNPFGLFDMLGNASEWTEDCWNESYLGAPADGSAWASGTCESHVLRGSNWTNLPWVLRSANRTSNFSGKRTNYIGFRVARTLP